MEQSLTKLISSDGFGRRELTFLTVVDYKLYCKYPPPVLLVQTWKTPSSDVQSRPKSLSHNSYWINSKIGLIAGTAVEEKLKKAQKAMNHGIANMEIEFRISSDKPPAFQWQITYTADSLEWKNKALKNIGSKTFEIDHKIHLWIFL